MAQLAIRDKALSALLACTVVSEAAVSGIEGLEQVRRLPAANLAHDDVIRAVDAARGAPDRGS